MELLPLDMELKPMVTDHNQSLVVITSFFPDVRKIVSLLQLVYLFDVMFDPRLWSWSWSYQRLWSQTQW